MTRSIPTRPSAEHYRNEAKALVLQVRAGSAAALKRVRRQLPRLLSEVEPSAFALHHAQRVLALEHGFPSWPRFKRHVETRASLAAAVGAVRELGFAVLHEALERAQVAPLLSECEKVLVRMNKSHTRVPLELHRRRPLGDDRVVCNPLVMPVVRELVGARAAIVGRGILGTRPGDRAMRPHRDRPMVRCISVGFMLTDFREDNGATEIWPRSHLIEDRDVEDVRNTPQRAARLPSTIVTAPAGSVLVRDMRAWHRSGVNRTRAPRIMLSLVYGEPPERRKPPRPRLP